MPQITIKLPAPIIDPDLRRRLAQGVTDVAVAVESIPDRPETRFFCWVIVEAVEPGTWTCGGLQPDHVVPCYATVLVPEGVLTPDLRRRYVEQLDKAIRCSLGKEFAQRVATSIVIQDVADGTWGANGAVMNLTDFVAKVGFEHLQHARN